MIRIDLPRVPIALLSSLIWSLSLFSSCTAEKKYVNRPNLPDAVRPAATVNINSAAVSELERLPNIGARLAAKIVEHRERYGPFRKREHLLVIEGISHRRFREIEDLVTVD